MTPDALKDKVQERIREARTDEAIRIFREYAQVGYSLQMVPVLKLKKAIA